MHIATTQKRQSYIFSRETEVEGEELKKNNVASDCFVVAVDFLCSSLRLVFKQSGLLLVNM